MMYNNYYNFNRNFATPSIKAQPNAAPVPSTGYTPQQIQKAYGFDQFYSQGYDGKGQKIYIINAYNDPNIQADVKQFNTTFGLQQFNITSGPTLTVANPQGTPPNDPTSNKVWALEQSLDVEWAHAIAPRADVVLVQAKSASLSDLFGAVDWAVQQKASIVSMSWSISESSSVPSYDFHFNIPNVAFFAAAGDSATTVAVYPATSPHVVSVGGTSLSLNSDNSWNSETVWSNAGGGISKYVKLPDFQKNYKLTYSGRSNPDVSYNANPVSGFAVYDSFDGKGLRSVGGTSAGAPQWGALTALANQARAAKGKGALSTQSLIGGVRFDYQAAGANYSSYYHDIISGSSAYRATAGYDLATGLGTPIANNLVPYLANI
ncbi:MAG: S53 family peptidase [Cyanobacteriota bacterium ELA615]